MASSKGLEDLPIDAVEYIASYISAKDLSSCCTVSRTWRTIFNDDIFWKKYCNKETDDCLKNSDSCVEPKFSLHRIKNSTLTTVSKCRLNFIRQQHLWRNWRCGRYKVNEIEFDCDDSISYNVKVEFVANDFVFLHTTFETQVWDVSHLPNLVMTIPFYLKELWENNFYRVVGNKLVVVQCNVVQVFNICLVSNSWSFAFAFFFDKPEEFSSSITAESDIDGIFQETSCSIAEDVVSCVIISGEFLVGFRTNQLPDSQPVMHIWNINNGKKVKEQTCEKIVEQSGIPLGIDLKTSCTSSQKILIVFDNNQIQSGSSWFFVYDLSQLDFLPCSEKYRLEDALFNDPCVCIFGEDNIKFFLIGSTSEEVFNISSLNGASIQAFGNNFIIASEKNVQMLIPSTKTLNTLFQVDCSYESFSIIHSRFIVFKDQFDNIIEVWELGKVYKKMFSLPEDMGAYRAVNDACSKIVLEHANKLIILDFW